MRQSGGAGCVCACVCGGGGVCVIEQCLHCPGVRATHKTSEGAGGAGGGWEEQEKESPPSLLLHSSRCVHGESDRHEGRV